MRLTSCGTVALLAGLFLLAPGAGIAHAQDAPKYEQLKQEYESAKAALKASHDAKNALAKEREDLIKQIQALQKQLNDVALERDDLARQAATQAERTYQLRSAHAAWQEFMKRYPALHARWKAFLETELLKPANDPPVLPEPTWPFRVQG